MFAHVRPLRLIALLGRLRARWQARQRLCGPWALPRQLAQLASGALLLDNEARVRYANAAFEQQSGYGLKELQGQPVPALQAGLSAKAHLQLIARQVASQGVWQGQVWSRHKDGRRQAEQVSVYPLANRQGYLVLCAPRHRNSDALPAAALQDALTGLMTLPQLQLKLDRACQQQAPFALLQLDLNDFRRINHQLDYQTGDLLLQALAERFRLWLQPEQLLARVEGDSFLFLLPGLTHPHQLAAVAEALLALLHRPFQVGRRKLHLAATLGGALWPRDSRNGDALLQQASMALFEARRQSLSFQAFSSPMQARRQYREQLQRELLDALAQQQIQLVYQPILDNRTGRVSKLEALARWHHPTLGCISPVDFIPLAEAGGLMQALGAQLLEQACRDLARLHQEGFTDLGMTINRSPQEFLSLSPSAEEWLTVIRQHGLDPRHITLEITESLFMNGHQEHLIRIQALRQAGCQMAIDDFGTGYSALSYLRLYPMDLVKIDRAFISQIPANPRDSQLLEGLISLVHNLGMALVVEGVETAEQQAFVTQHGCAYSQGFLFSRPRPLSELLTLLGQPALRKTHQIESLHQ